VAVLNTELKRLLS